MSAFDAASIGHDPNGLAATLCRKRQCSPSQGTSPRREIVQLHPMAFKLRTRIPRWQLIIQAEKYFWVNTTANSQAQRGLGGRVPTSTQASEWARQCLGNTSLYSYICRYRFVCQAGSRLEESCQKLNLGLITAIFGAVCYRYCWDYVIIWK